MKVGLDLIEIQRIRDALERYPRFRERCFTEAEREYCDSRANPAQHYAARFAGKEAVGKALGFGVARAFAWKDVEIAGRPKPSVRLSGRIEAWSERVGAGEIDLSNAAQITRAVVGGVPNEAVGLVMDLSDVAYLDSAGVRMLAELERRLGWRSQAFRVVAPEGSRTRKVLSIAGLDGLLVLDASVESASAGMKRSTDVG